MMGEEMKDMLAALEEGARKAMTQAARLAALKEKPLLTPAEVEELYGFKVSKLAKGRSFGTGPAYVQAEERGRVYYRPVDLDAYVAKCRKRA